MSYEALPEWLQLLKDQTNDLALAFASELAFGKSALRINSSKTQALPQYNSRLTQNQAEFPRRLPQCTFLKVLLKDNNS